MLVLWVLMWPYVLSVGEIMFGLNYDQIVALVSAVVAGIAVGWARVSSLRARSAKETAVRANEQSLHNQSDVNDNYLALVEMQKRVGEMAVAIAQLQAAVDVKDKTIRVLEEKVDILESTVKVLRDGNDHYQSQLAEVQAQLDKANELLEKRG